MKNFWNTFLLCFEILSWITNIDLILHLQWNVVITIPIPLNRRNFIRQQLQGAGVVIGTRGRKPGNVGQLSRLTARHFPTKILPKPGTTRSNPTRKCTVCFPAERQLRQEAGLPPIGRPGRESSYECRECGVGLCVDPCFRLYHTHKYPVLAYKRLRAQEEWYWDAILVLKLVYMFADPLCQESSSHGWIPCTKGQ